MKGFEKLDYKKVATIPWGSNLTGRYPKPNRKYILTLKRCLQPATMKEIYPGIKNPITHELRTLWALGYLDKYRKINSNRVKYLLTAKGFELIQKAFESTEA